MKKAIILAASLLITPALVQASAIDERLAEYKTEGASNFSAAAGKAMWNKEVVSEEGDKRSCATCHNSDLTKAGKHRKTGKVIAAMAPSVPTMEGEEVRYSEGKKIEKWFKRNCKWTYGRECTAQEKGDFLTYLKGL